MKFNYRFKIIEQIIIVMIFAVLTPMIISGFIINNVSQHTIRRELNYSASMLSEVVVKNLETVFYAAQSELNTITMAIKHFPKSASRKYFLESIRKDSKEIDDVILADISVYNEKFKNNKNYYYNKASQKLLLGQPLDSKNCLIASIDRNTLIDKLFDIFKNDTRQVYILDEDGELLLSNNFSQKEYEYAIESLPQKLIENRPQSFGKVKNQPLSYYKLDNPPLTVIVNTTSAITQNTINIARYKIILAIVLSVLFIFIMVGLYTSYLYVNIKQLFKGIMALSKGNYKRKIRLISKSFTPFELVFLAKEFNLMVNEINHSYKQILQKNKELKKLDELRANLIDTVSHEFRTPLTSIKGYTSRLLRSDIQIDDETKNKSLKIIKRQSERLSRMVEDLLVIPDIEGAKLNINIEQVDLNEVVQLSINSLKSVDTENILVNIPDDFPLIYADEDRIEQVLINLLENAKKYALDNTNITLSAYSNNNVAYIKVENEAPYISQEKIEHLFDKFMRLDDTTTRTTRGAGLGLFIVKGLVEAMHGNIKLHSTSDNRFIATISIPIVQQG